MSLQPLENKALWLFYLTGVWHWAIREIAQDAEGGTFYTRQAFHNLLARGSATPSLI